MPELDQSIRLSFPFSLADRIRASLLLLTQHGRGVVFALVWPVIGLAFLAFLIFHGKQPGAGDWLVVAGCLLFIPIIVVFTHTLSYFTNKPLREPFDYTFDAGGIHVSAVTYAYTHRWPAISQVKPLGGFLMFFFSPGCAHCVPDRVIDAAGVRQDLLALAHAHGVRIVGN